MAKHSPLQLHSPVRLWATRLVLVILAATGGYLVYEFGRIQAGYDLVDAASGQLAACHMTQPGSGHSAAPARGNEARKSA